MSDLSNPNSGLSSPPLSDLEAAFQGGKSFIDRMNEMDALRQTMDMQRRDAIQALTNLAIGQDIAKAQKDALAALSEANDKLAAADDILANAKTTAAKILSDARSSADNTLRDADIKANQTISAAQDQKKQSDEYVADANARADSALADAARTLSELTAKSIACEAAKKAADDAKIAADLMHAKMLATIDAHHKRISQLSAILAQPVEI